MFGMWLIRSGTANTLLKRLQAVGKMALTNYLMQTLICTTIFYGHGLALFGEVSRDVQITVVIIIWSLQIIYSTIWLQHYQSGPAEWLRRSLTYGKIQPIKLRKVAIGQ